MDGIIQFNLMKWRKEKKNESVAFYSLVIFLKADAIAELHLVLE